MKPLGIKAKVALVTSITSVLMIGLVTLVQTQRMKADYTRVLFTQQSALVNRTAQELDDKLTMLLDIIALSARNQPPALAASGDKLREYYQDRAVLALFDELNIQGLTLCIVTHDHEVAARAKRRIAFRDGHVVSDDGASPSSSGAPRAPR